LLPGQFSSRADAFIEDQPGPLAVSDLASVEFSSAIAWRVRMRLLTADQARPVLSWFDQWVMRSAIRAEINSTDIALAEAF
jgi:hypothetical protein